MVTITLLRNGDRLITFGSLQHDNTHEVLYANGIYGRRNTNTCKQIYYLLYKRRSMSAWKLRDILEPAAIYLETWRQIMSVPDIQLHYGLTGKIFV
jgi:predicted cupin superfamily sugar epimerase